MITLKDICLATLIKHQKVTPDIIKVLYYEPNPKVVAKLCEYLNICWYWDRETNLWKDIPKYFSRALIYNEKLKLASNYYDIDNVKNSFLRITLEYADLEWFKYVYEKFQDVYWLTIDNRHLEIIKYLHSTGCETSKVRLEIRQNSNLITDFINQNQESFKYSWMIGGPLPEYDDGIEYVNKRLYLGGAGYENASHNALEILEDEGIINDFNFNEFLDTLCGKCDGTHQQNVFALKYLNKHQYLLTNSSIDKYFHKFNYQTLLFILKIMFKTNNIRFSIINRIFRCYRFDGIIKFLCDNYTFTYDQLSHIFAHYYINTKAIDTLLTKYKRMLHLKNNKILSEAARTDDTDLLRELLKYESVVNGSGRDWSLIMAAKKGNLEIFKMLVDTGKFSLGFRGNSAFIEACMYNKRSIIDYIYEITNISNKLIKLVISRKLAKEVYPDDKICIKYIADLADLEVNFKSIPKTFRLTRRSCYSIYSLESSENAYKFIKPKS